MGRKGALVALLALGLALVVPRAPWSDAPRAEPQRAAISRSGVLDGADYLIEVPANWRGGLVVYAHGIQRGPGPGAVGPPPTASHIIGEGHAWIASGYRAREYQPRLFIEDLVALRELFLKEIEPPRWAIIYGQSMGGHIVVASLELRPALYAGTDHLLVQRVVRSPSHCGFYGETRERAFDSRPICHASGSSGRPSCTRRIRSPRGGNLNSEVSSRRQRFATEERPCRPTVTPRPGGFAGA